MTSTNRSSCHPLNPVPRIFQSLVNYQLSLAFWERTGMEGRRLACAFQTRTGSRRPVVARMLFLSLTPAKRSTLQSNWTARKARLDGCLCKQALYTHPMKVGVPILKDGQAGCARLPRRFGESGFVAL